MLRIQCYSRAVASHALYTHRTRAWLHWSVRAIALRCMRAIVLYTVMLRVFSQSRHGAHCDLHYERGAFSNNRSAAFIVVTFFHNFFSHLNIRFVSRGFSKFFLFLSIESMKGCPRDAMLSFEMILVGILCELALRQMSNSTSISGTQQQQKRLPCQFSMCSNLQG